MEITGIVLAGGKGTRMGRRKEFLELEGKPMIEYSIDALKVFTEKIIIATDNVLPFCHFPFLVVSDIFKGCGAIAGVHSGLLHSSTEYSLILPCDTPLIKHEVLGLLIDSVERDINLVVPEVSGNFEMVCALYSKRTISSIEKLIQRGELSLLKLMRIVRWKRVSKEEIVRVDPDTVSFRNINRQEDIDEAVKILKKKGKE